MSIRREQLEAQLQALRQQEQQHLSNLQAVNGAIQLCEQLIAMVDSPTERPNGEAKLALVPDSVPKPAQA